MRYETKKEAFAALHALQAEGRTNVKVMRFETNFMMTSIGSGRGACIPTRVVYFRVVSF